MTRMSKIPPELLAEMTPAVRVFVESLLVRMADMQMAMQAEIDELKAQVKRLTPQNSSVPPSTQHPNARKAKAEIKEAARRTVRTSSGCSGTGPR